MASIKPPTKKHLGSVIVIGGCGFLGHHIVRQLLESYDCTTLSVLDLRTTQNRFDAVSYHSADITSPAAVRAVFETVKPQVIIHTASPTIVDSGASNNAKQSSHAMYYKVNVGGTKNLIERAGEVGTVKAFVYTSSSSVIHDSVSDLVNADERYPLLFSPAQKEYYSETKALAEQVVLSANRKHGSMLTASIRPAGIFGEGDVQLAANMLMAYWRGQTKFQLGENENLFDFTYVGNVAHAHILAAIALLSTHSLDIEPLDHERVDGEAFLITNGQPVYFWDFPRMLWRAAGDATTKEQIWTIHRDTGLVLATLIEWLFWFAGGRTPNLTRLKVKYSCMTRYFNIDKARKVLGYVPVWGMEEAVQRTADWFVEKRRREMDGEREKKVR